MIKRIAALLLLLAALRAGGLLPFQSSDVAQLVPVQALVISQGEKGIVLDGGECRGIGLDWDSAWQDLQNSADGHLFLGTADHVILCGDAVELLPQVIKNQQLRPAASVCVCPQGVPDARSAASYLDAHDGGVTLLDVRTLQLRTGVVELPRLVMTQGGLRLYGSKDR